MMNNKKVLTSEERISLNRKIAESYFSAYDQKLVKDGKTYDNWIFAENADYWSPYFGNGTINLYEHPISPADSATMEALSYSIEFPDWTALDFECWPSVEGVAWKSHFGGHKKDNGDFMDFFAYSYIKTNEYGEIIHWETHVNCDYNDFLDVAIGEHGPYKNGADEYMDAVMRKLKSAGIDIASLAHKN